MSDIGTIALGRRTILRMALGAASLTALGAIAGCAPQPIPEPTKAPTAAPAAASKSVSEPTKAPTTAPAATSKPISEPTKAPIAAPAATKAPTAKLSGRLEVWGAVPAENGVQDLCNEFMRRNPGVTVNYTRFILGSGGDTKLDTALQAGNQVDVYFSHDIPRLDQRIRAGAAIELGPYASAAGGAIAKFANDPGIYRPANGKTYTIPVAREPAYLMVNKNMWQAAGVALVDQWNDPKWDQAAFRTAMKKLSGTVNGKPVYGILTGPRLEIVTLGPNRWYKPDGKSANFDHPAFRNYWELNHALIFDDKSELPWKDMLAENLRVYAQNPLMQGRVASWPTANWSLRYVRDTQNYPHDWITTFVPYPLPAGTTKPFNRGGFVNWSHLAPTKNVDLGWTFLTYWLTDGNDFMYRAGKIPAILEGQSVDKMTTGLLGPEANKLFDVDAFKKVVLGPANPYFIDTVTTGSTEIQQIEQDLTDLYFIGELTIDQLIARLQDQANAAIRKALA